jgi:hypothetical protein
MKLRPQGASVVPIVAVTSRRPSRSSGSIGTTRPCAAAPQSGPASSPAAMYAAKAVASAINTCSILWKPPRSTSADTRTAATGTLT